MWVWSMWVWSLTPPHMYRSLQRVRRALRQMKDYVKLSMYNHFSYALIFAVVVAVVFTAWLFIDVNFPKNGCLEVWGIEYWERDHAGYFGCDGLCRSILTSEVS